MQLELSNSKGPGVRIAKQTHASFVDRLFMRNRVALLD